MNPHRPQATRAHASLFQHLFALERSGKFDQALQELRGLWDDTSQPPETDGLDNRATAEMLLRCGALIGFLGHSRQIPTAQTRSRDLLTEARSLFLESYAPEKLAECENYLALAYWRTGEINEATNWVDEAHSHDLSPVSNVRLYSHVIRNLILLSQKRYSDICASFDNLEQLFLESADSFLCGNFYMNYGLAAKNVGEIRAAQDALALSRDFFEKSGNKIQVAMAQNNLSQAYKAEHRFPEAHAAIDRSIELFQELGDRTREGFSLDTKALIFLEEGRYEDALETVERAIAILRKSENYGYLTETITTKAKIQLFADDFSTAMLTLVEAVDLAKVRIGESVALNLIHDFEAAMKSRNSPKVPRVSEPDRSGLAVGDLRLILPREIANFDDYHGVWINNSDLEPYGLRRGSLAVVVPSEVKRGDLVAVMEIETESVSCGFFDTDFGIVCLEAGGSEPQLFSDSDVRVLGKIVGVCDTEPGADGTMNVRALEL